MSHEVVLIEDKDTPPRSSCCMICTVARRASVPTKMSPRIIMTSLSVERAPSPKLLIVQAPTNFQQRSNPSILTQIQSTTDPTILTMASATRKDLLKKVYTMVPPMLESFHKGMIRFHLCSMYLANILHRSTWSCGCHWWQRRLHRCAILFCDGLSKTWLRHGTIHPA